MLLCLCCLAAVGAVATSCGLCGAVTFYLAAAAAASPAIAYTNSPAAASPLRNALSYDHLLLRPARSGPLIAPRGA